MIIYEPSSRVKQLFNLDLCVKRFGNAPLNPSAASGPVFCRSVDAQEDLCAILQAMNKWWAVIHNRVKNKRNILRQMLSFIVRKEVQPWIGCHIYDLDVFFCKTLSPMVSRSLRNNYNLRSQSMSHTHTHRVQASQMLLSCMRYDFLSKFFILKALNWRNLPNSAE